MRKSNTSGIAGFYRVPKTIAFLISHRLYVKLKKSKPKDAPEKGQGRFSPLQITKQLICGQSNPQSPKRLGDIYRLVWLFILPGQARSQLTGHDLCQRLQPFENRMTLARINQDILLTQIMRRAIGRLMRLHIARQNSPCHASGPILRPLRQSPSPYSRQ